MGLHVEAVRRRDDEESLVALIVSVEPIPFGLTLANPVTVTEVKIGCPLDGNQVVENISPAIRDRTNVVDFPTKA